MGGKSVWGRVYCTGISLSHILLCGGSYIPLSLLYISYPLLSLYYLTPYTIEPIYFALLHYILLFLPYLYNIYLLQ